MTSTNAQKLGIRPGGSVLILGMEASDAISIVGELPTGTTIVASGRLADVVILFARTVDDVSSRATDAFPRVSAAGRCWVAYRKGASRTAPADVAPLHRDTLQAALKQTGHDGVTLVSLDEVWSAMRIKRV